jgi:ribonuclease BN (tRNA processing enzyme)
VPLRAVIVGVGSALATRRYGASAVILAPQGLLMIDSPDSVLHALRRASEVSGIDLAPLRINDILLTHLHGDHANGLEAIAWTHWLARQDERTSASPPARRPRIHTIAPVAARLWEKLAPSLDQGGSLTLHDYFDVRVLVPGSPASICGATVVCREGDHGIPCIGFRIAVGDSELGWSGDTRFDRAHVEWLAEADLMVHETTESSVHTPLAALNALPAALRRRMRLMHLEDQFDPAATDIACLEEGQVLEVEPAPRSASDR